jgi:hypothetical protein
MKMRASLLQFAAVVAAVVLIAAWGLTIFHRHQPTRTGFASAQTGHLSKPDLGQIRALYARLPMSFEANVGQAEPEVQFLSRGRGYELFLTREDAVLALQRNYRLKSSPRAKLLGKASTTGKTSLLRLHFEGANADAVEGVGRLPGRIDYFVGNDPKDWHTDVPSYGRVAYRGIYPGVDAVFYGNQRQLEYDLVVAPGADPAQIALRIDGASDVKTNADGNVEMRVAGANVELLKPAVYQEFNGERRGVTANYVVGNDHRVRFSVAGYDRGSPLVIDPVLSYSTYLGGSAGNTNVNFDGANGIAVDSLGDAYVTGVTFSTKFPITSSAFPADPNVATIGAAFVTEMNPAGTSQLYSTYLSGNGAGSGGAIGDNAAGIAVDSAGDIYVTGLTYSTNFPTTTNALNQTGPSNGNILGTAFVSAINPANTGTAALVYSTYLGGTGGDGGKAIAADSAGGNVYVTGYTLSTDFPMTTPSTAYQTTMKSAIGGNAFLARLDTTKSGTNSLIYSTYLGGTSSSSSGDFGLGITVDSSHNAYFAGLATSTDFPTTANALLPGPYASIPNETGFVARIDTTQSGAGSLIYSSYLGSKAESSSSDADAAIAIALGPSNIAYVTGQTTSSDFPVTNASGLTANAGIAFVALIDTTKSGSSSLPYSTLLGGTGGDIGLGIAADSSKNAYVGGGTSSTGIATVGAFQTGLQGGGDGFVAKVSPNGNGAADFAYFSYFGGSGNAGLSGQDVVNGIALDSSSPPNVYITGQTFSTAATFPVYPSTAFQTTLTQFDSAAVSAGFVAKLTLEPTIVFSATTLAFGNESVGSTAVNCGALAPCLVTLTNNTGVAIPITLQTITATAPSVATDFAAGGAGTTCAGSVPAGGNCTIAVTFTPSVAIAETATLPIQYTAGNNAAAVQNIVLTGTGTAVANYTLLPASLTFATTQLAGTTSPSQPLTLTNTSAAVEVFTITASANFSETDNCSGAGGIAGGANCTINVSLAPTATGTLNGTITAASGGAMQVTTLSGTGGDFSLTSLPASVTVTNNAGSFQATLSTTPQGFAPTVTYACTTTIPNGSCTTSIAGQTVMVSIAVASAVPPSGQRVDGQRLMRPAIPLVAAVLLFLTLPLLRRRRAWLGLAGVVLALCVFSSCTGTSNTHNYSLTLTASSASNGTTVNHVYTVQVVVK